MNQHVHKKVYYGWWVLSAAFMCCFMFSGGVYFAFSLFIRPLQMEFGWDRSIIMFAFTLMVLTSGIASLAIGNTVDRYGPRVIMCLGALILGIGFFSLGFIERPLHYYICYIVIGVGGSAIGPVPSTTVVSNWFGEKRGLAIGIMSTGIGLGGFVLSPLVGGVIIPLFGWRAAYVCLGLLSCILVPLSLLVIRTSPGDRGESENEKQDERAATISATPVEELEGLSLRGALSSMTFWIIAGAFTLSQFGNQGVIQNQVPHLQDIGYPVLMASGALGGLGLVSAFSKLFFGWLCDQIDPKYAFSIGVVFIGFGTIILMMVRSGSSPLIIWFYALIMGFASGSWLPTMSMLVSTRMGLVSYGSVFGAVTLVFNLGVSTGPLVAGFIYDATQSYQWAFIIFLLLYVISIPAMLSIGGLKNADAPMV